MCYFCCRLFLLFVFFYDYFSLSLFFLFLSLVLRLSLTFSIRSSLSFSLSFFHTLCLTHFSSPAILSWLCVLPTNATVLFNFTWCVILFLSSCLFLFLYIFLFAFIASLSFFFDLMKSAKLETLSPSLVCRLWCYVLYIIYLNCLLSYPRTGGWEASSWAKRFLVSSDFNSLG